MTRCLRVFAILAGVLLVPVSAWAQWETPNRAFHKAAIFPIEGKHLSVPCASCHIQGQVKGTPTTCADCHFVRRQDDRYRGRLGMECESCHRPTSWTAVKWDHGAQAGMPLNAAHKALSCDNCHRNGLFTGVNLQCGTCHAADYAAAKTPDHKAAGFPTTCDLCHRPADTTFSQGRFDHNSVFRLQGLHATTTCTSCHGSGVYRGTPRDCVGCHRPEFDRTTTPNHRAAGIGTDCVSCHSPSSSTFTRSNFSHNSVFALVGAHASQDCASCHKNGVLAGTPRDCVGCHRADYQRTTTPNHAAAGFSTSCESCHKATDSSWRGPSFNHASVFPLVGKHSSTACATCHVNNVFKGTPTTCVGCHLTNYQRTTAPSHAAAGFPTACESCHRPTDASWDGGTAFNHATVFSLVGKHASTACATCHVNNVFKGTARDCVGCHRTEYQRTTTPSHAAAGFSTVCESCHKATDASWRGVSFNHASVFPLVGKHSSTACATCHVNNVFKGTPTTCVGCHLTNYQRTTAPSHAAAGFPTTCESCHRPTDASWDGGTVFNHASVFALVGKHASTACATCHVNNVFKGTPKDCVGCHRTEYQRTTTPNHAAAGFSTVCESCHKATDASWRGVSFNHASVFPLVGKHSSTACATCHVNNVFKGTPTTCVGCHLTSYQRSTAPNHAAAGFPTSCESCHRATDATWQGGSFNHNSVYQLLGRHATTACSLCHTNNTYRGTPRECYPCHVAQYQRTTMPSHVAASFPTTCVTCHNGADSSWNQGRFTHTWFPITSGKHANIACTTCHANPATFTQFTCLTGGCHTRTKMDDTHKNRTGYAYDSNRCYACHPTGRGD